MDPMVDDILTVDCNKALIIELIKEGVADRNNSPKIKH